MDSEQVNLIFTEVWPYNFHVSWQDFQKAGFFLQKLAISFSKKWTSAIFYVDQLAHILVCLECWLYGCDIMAVIKTLFLGKTGFAERWLVWKKKPFLPFLTRPAPTFWPKKYQTRNSLSSSLVKKDRNYIIINFLTLRLKWNYWKLSAFLPFLTQIRQKFGPNIL